MDMFNGEILSFGISQKPSAENIMSIRLAINITNDCSYRRTFHSDRGWLIRCSQKLKEKQNISEYVKKKGNCHDNSVMGKFLEY